MLHICDFSADAVLSVGLVLESSTGIVADYNAWRARTGRAVAVIPVEEQPADVDSGDWKPETIPPLNLDCSF